MASVHIRSRTSTHSDRGASGHHHRRQDFCYPFEAQSPPRSPVLLVSHSRQLHYFCSVNPPHAALGHASLCFLPLLRLHCPPLTRAITTPKSVHPKPYLTRVATSTKLACPHPAFVEGERGRCHRSRRAGATPPTMSSQQSQPNLRLTSEWWLRKRLPAVLRRRLTETQLLLRMDCTSEMSSVRSRLSSSSSSSLSLLLIPSCRISRPFRCRHRHWRADPHHVRHKEDLEPLLERKLRFVSGSDQIPE